MNSNKPTSELRRHINKQFSSRCIFLANDSLTYLTEQLGSFGSGEQRQKTLAKMIDLIEAEGVGSELQSLDRLKELLKTVSRIKKSESEVPFKLENAVEWLQSITADKGRATLTDRPAWEKLGFDAYRQRFELVKMLLENEQKFDPVDSVLAKRGARIRILGQLCRGMGGAGSGFQAEDSTGTVHLELDSALYEPGIYFEGGIFAFEGRCSANGDRIEVERVELPRTRSIELTSAKDKTAGGAAKRNPNDRIVLLSEVVLDDDRVIEALRKILDGFATSPPNAFVLCGHFLSTQLAFGYTEQAAAAFLRLADILHSFEHHYADTQFVLVPSVDDPPPGQMLPCPPLSPSIQKCFASLRLKMHFPTNPCRLTFKDQHILILRDDIVEKLCRSAVHMPRDATAAAIPKLFCSTVRSQHHLSPLPIFNSPVQLHFDPLFQLWPAPDVLMIADRFGAFVEENEGQHAAQRLLMMNPGPFMGRQFQVYYPALRRVEYSELAAD